MKLSALLLGSALLSSAFVSSASALTHTFTYAGKLNSYSGAVPSEGSYFFADNTNPQSFVLTFDEAAFNAAPDSNPDPDISFYKFNGSLSYQLTPVAGNQFTGASLPTTPFSYTFTGLLQLSYFMAPGLTNVSLTVADEAMIIANDPAFGGSPSRVGLGLSWSDVTIPTDKQTLSILFENPTNTDVRISHPTTGSWLALVGNGNAKLESHTTSGGPINSVPDTASTLALSLAAMAGLLVVGNRKRSALCAA